MKEMTGAERIFAALRLKEPDRVPHFELGVNRTVRQAILPGSTNEDMIEHFDWDAVNIDDRGYPGYRVENLEPSGKAFRDQWGVVRKVSSESVDHPVEAAVKSEADLDKWKAPDPDDPRRYKKILENVKRYKGKRAVIVSFADPFNVANDVRGATDHYMDFIRNPALIDRLAGLIRDYYLKYIRNCAQAGADVMFVTGDYATTRWPMLSREHFAKHVIPTLKSLVDECRKHNLLVMKHSDGNIMPIADMIVDTGINGLHPIDPSAGMDMGVMKEKYGDRVCLMGNVQCTYVLTWGTVAEVREDVKRCIRQGARGGGLICMSSNTIHSAVKPENYVEMVKAIREFGRYPITV